MPDEFQYDVFLSHSTKDKAVVRPLAERLREAGPRLWFDEWGLKAGDSLSSGEMARVRASETEAGLEHSQFGFRVSGFGFAQPGMSANAFGSDWAQLACPAVALQRRLKAGTCGRGNLPFRAPLNKERRLIPLRLDDAPIKSSQAQFLYTNLRSAGRKREHPRLMGSANQHDK